MMLAIGRGTDQRLRLASKVQKDYYALSTLAYISCDAPRNVPREKDNLMFFSLLVKVQKSDKH